MKFILEAEKIPAEPAALQLLAQAADGSLRDGLSLLDQLLAFGGGQVAETETRAMLGTVDRERVWRLLQALAAQDATQLLREADALDEYSPDHGQVLEDMAAVLARVALRQAVPGYEGDELYSVAWIADLATRLDAADVQLYYQTAIVARRDLPLAPDPALGFKVSLLRMLAFRPAAMAGNAAAPAPAAAPAATGAAPAATPVRSASGPALSPGSSVPQGGAGLDLGAITAARWVSLLPDLGLGGAARQLAANCLPCRSEGDLLHLLLPPASRHLKTRQQEEKIAQALSRLCGRVVRIEIEIGDTPEPTAAQRAEQQAAAQLASAEQALHQDPNVQNLQKMFGAVVQSGSIRINSEDQA
jgi:DNA polymerase III subunit gamma/tau